jgi:hypothetical protein
MSLCRDLTVSLWPASCQGVSLLFQIADEFHVPSFGVSEFPESNGCHAGDRGERRRIFEGFAYVTGDEADHRAIVAALASRGPGTLAVPMLGLVQIRCDAFERRSDRDRLGYICFAVKFVRDTTAAAIGPVSLPGRMVFDAAGRMAAALINLFPAALTLGSDVDYVINAAVYMVETVAASIELVRTSTFVDPDISVQVEAAGAAITTAAPLLITATGAASTDVTDLLAAAPPLDATYSDPTATLAAVIVAAIRLLCDGMAGNDDSGASALLELALDYPAVKNSEPVSASSAAATANSASIVDLARLAALTAWCEGLARRSYASRPDALAARAAAADRLGQELDHAAGAGNVVLYAAIQDLRDAIVQYLARLTIDLAPVVSLPAVGGRTNSRQFSKSQRFVGNGEHRTSVADAARRRGSSCLQV